MRNTRKAAQAETEDVMRKMAAEGAKVTAIDKAPIQQRAPRTASRRWRRMAPGRPACGTRSRSSDRMLASYRRLLDRIGAIERVFGIGLIFLIVIAITVQVFTRYALGRPIAWVEESATYAFIWMVFVGASAGLKRAVTSGSPPSSRTCRRASRPGCARWSGCWCSAPWPCWWSRASR